MNYLALFTLFQAIIASVKETTGGFELDLTARINLHTGYFLNALHTIGYSHYGILTIGAGDNNSDTLAFGDDFAPSPSATITGLLVPFAAASPNGVELCIAPEVCPLPSGLLRGLLVPLTSTQTSLPDIDTLRKDLVVVSTRIPLKPLVFHSTVYSAYIQSCIVLVLVLFVFVFLKFFKFSRHIFSRPGATPTRRTIFRRTHLQALVPLDVTQITISTALSTSLPINITPHSPAIIDISDPEAVVGLFSIIAEQSYQLAAFDAHIKSQDLIIHDQSQTIASVSSELQASQTFAAAQSCTITGLQFQHAASQAASMAQNQELCDNLAAEKQENERLRAENRHLQDTIIASKADNALSSQIIVRMSEEASAAQEASESALDAAHTENASLKDLVCTQNNTIAERDATLTNVIVTIAFASIANSSLRRQLRGKAQRVTALTSQVQTLQTDSTNQSAQRTVEIKNLTSAHATELSIVSDELQDSQAQHAHTQHSLTATREKLAQTQAELKSERISSDSLRAVVSKKTGTIRELRRAGSELIIMYEERIALRDTISLDVAKAATRLERSRGDKRLAEEQARYKELEARLAKPHTTSIPSSNSLHSLNDTHARLSARPSHGNLLDVNISVSASLAAMPSFTSICAIAATSSSSISALATQPVNMTSVARTTTVPSLSAHAKNGVRKPPTRKPSAPSTKPTKPTLRTQTRAGKENTLSTKPAAKVSTSRASSRLTSKRPALA
ncbi:unnamed protein product [Peniophora sp. CBMAI 1063]|nr:unnamed protein product [Peniophora sp. CBMAI 1063]